MEASAVRGKKSRGPSKETGKHLPVQNSKQVSEGIVHVAHVSELVGLVYRRFQPYSSGWGSVRNRLVRVVLRRPPD